MNTINKTAKFLPTITRFATAAGLSLYFTGKRSLKTQAFAENSLKKLLTEQEKDNVVKQIKITYNGKFLSADSIVSIQKASRKFSSADCYNLTLTNRKIRRDNQDNLPFFAKSFEEYLVSSYQISENATSQVLERLSISDNTFYQAMEHYYAQGEEKVVGFQNNAIEEEANELHSSQLLSFHELKPIVIRMTELLEAERANISTVKLLLINPRFVTNVLICRAHDTIFKEFGIEGDKLNESLAASYPLFESHAPEVMERYAQAVASISETK